MHGLSVEKQQENCAGRHSKRIKESKWGTSRESMWIKHIWSKSNISYSELARNYFLFKVQIT